MMCFFQEQRFSVESKSATAVFCQSCLKNLNILAYHNTPTSFCPFLILNSILIETGLKNTIRINSYPIFDFFLDLSVFDTGGVSLLGFWSASEIERRK